MNFRQDTWIRIGLAGVVFLVCMGIGMPLTLSLALAVLALSWLLLLR